MTAAPIRVLLADDDKLFLASLKALIDRQPELMVVAAAENGLEAIELAASLEIEALPDRADGRLGRVTAPRRRQGGRGRGAREARAGARARRPPRGR